MRATLIFLGVVLILSACGGEESVREVSMEQEDPPISNVSTPRIERPGVGSVFPEFEALTLDGEPYELDPSAARMTMVNLWATWCVPCRREIPELIRIADEYRDDGLEIVGVSVDQAGMAEQVRKYTEESGVNYTIVHDPRMGLVDSLRTPTIPTTALIDSSGEIVWMHVGMVYENDPALMKQLETLRSDT